MARIAGINIPQNKLVQIGLTYIYGIGDKYSKQICEALKFPREKRVNQLTDDEILKIRDQDKCMGIIYLGYPNEDWPKGQRKPIEYVTEWYN